MLTRFFIRSPLFILLITSLIAILCPRALAQESNEKDPVKNDAEDQCKRYNSFVWENDIIAADDGGYSNGFAYSWGYADIQCSDAWVKKIDSWLTDVSQLHGQENSGNTPYTFQLAHVMSTPSDIEDPELIPNDRPYTGLMFSALNIFHHDEKSATHYELLLGAVGPITQAEEIQSFIHRSIGISEPEGWEHQTNNELVFRLGIDKSWKLYQGSIFKNYESDLIGMSDIKAGNLSSDVGAGLSYRIGRGLTKSTASHSIIPGRSIPALMLKPGDWALFFTLYGNYVFNNIVIEGNTRQDSHSVPLVNEQLRFTLGGYYQFKSHGFSASLHQSSEQFEGLHENTIFLTLGLSY